MWLTRTSILANPLARGDGSLNPPPGESPCAAAAAQLPTAGIFWV
jgi:hypothetical protein